MKNTYSDRFDLRIGVQHSNYQTPGNFKYTKFCKITPGKLFSSNYFQMTNLLAAGTVEGPILIYTEKAKALSHVCLLCGHTASITDILQIDDTSFLSVSNDGTMYRWSNDDCSCISHFNNITESGEVRLSKHLSNQNLVWIYTIGFIAILFDIEKGEKIKQINTVGINGVAYLDPKKCVFVNDPMIAITQFNVLNTFKDDFTPIRKYALGFKLHQNYFLSEYGFIRTNDKTWEIISPMGLAIIAEGTIKGRNRNDFICSIKWFDSQTFCIGTYLGKFIIITLEITRNYNEVRVKVQDSMIVLYPTQTFINDFYFFGNKIVFTTTPYQIQSMDLSRKSSTNSLQENTKIYHIPRDSSGRVIESDGKKSFYVRNCEKGGNLSLSHTCNSKITALASRESQRMKLEIIVGCSDGTVSFFSENTAKPFHTEVVFSCPVIGLAHLPIKIRGRPTLLVIGSDGSIALIKHTLVHMTYANYEFRITAAYYHSIDESLIVRREDSSYIIFKISEPGPVMFTTHVPDNSYLLWSENEIAIGRDPLSTNQMKFGRNSWFYTSVCISQFADVHSRRYKMFSQLLLRLFKTEYDFNLTRSQSLNFSNVDSSNSTFTKSQSIQSLVDWVSPENPPVKLRRTRHPHQKIVDGLSIVIVSYEKAATFFYPKYRVCGNLSFMLSNPVSAGNIIIKTLISGETSEYGYPELITEITKLLICGDFKIEVAASMECDRFIESISDELAQKLIDSSQSIKSSNSNKSETDFFLLALLAVKHHNLIPRNELPYLLDFLLKISDSSRGCASLALSILIHGFAFWSEMKSELLLFNEFIKCFVRMERPKAVEEMFLSLAVEKLDILFSAISTILSESQFFYFSQYNQNNSTDQNADIIRNIVGLASKVAFFKPKLCGVRISEHLITIASQMPNHIQIQQIIKEELKVHALFITAISMMNDLLVIGRNDGIVAIYRNFKLIFSEQAFQSSIDYTSIGPNSQYCAILSIGNKKAKVFSLHLQGILSSLYKRKEVETILDPVGNHYQLFWTDEKHCHFTVVD
ncbi:hypothetical protein TRFO_08423 [Tritrichomonas foetus]|uniref:Uncharacterized protein n=1 Tax=Tritrichomonas foetus TaxID=1144522 RepID=A0A1J4JLC5_9EUKA|nr:hypothetical protein TRFO_08423 [Tritrichomonas foetus]|eukprot:OHS99473.1 hypothetical protein TRFO_08423 [Tritrichomonas foetus]